MTDKEKLKKLKKLAGAMYYAAMYLTTDASQLHKAMDEYHKFIIHECKEEPVSKQNLSNVERTVKNWKDAQGDDLPEIDREVVALLDNGKVVFAHRPPEFWDGKNIITGKVTRNYPKTYDKGGWNIPDVKWWLDCSMPKEIEL